MVYIWQTCCAQFSFICWSCGIYLDMNTSIHSFGTLFISIHPWVTACYWPARRTGDGGVVCRLGQRILLKALRKLLWQSGYKNGLIAELSHRSQKVTSYQWCWMHRPLQAARMIISRVYGAQQMANTHTMMARDLAIFLSLDRRLGWAALLVEGSSLPKQGEEVWEWIEPLTASFIPTPQLWDRGIPSPWAEAGSLIWRWSWVSLLWSLLLRMLR